MKRIIVLIVMAFTIFATNKVGAHDFEVVNSDGKTIYYEILGNDQVEVTHKGDYGEAYTNEYTGAINIPLNVTYNGTTYSVTSIGNYAFYYCTTLTSVEVPNSVTSIGDGAFNYCVSLTSVEIPNTVTTIGARAFKQCSSLTSVIIGNSVTSIGNYAFNNCSNLTSVTCLSSVPTTLDYSVFYSTPNYKQLKVPCGSENAYIASLWGTIFSNITTIFPTYTINLFDTTCQGEDYISYGFAVQRYDKKVRCRKMR